MNGAKNREKTRQVIDVTDRYGAHNYHPLDIVLCRGEGVWVWDVDGNRYMDMLSAYSALNQGHRHPRVMKALAEQAEKLTLTSRAFHNDLLGEFCRLLAGLCGMDRVLPMNTGAEAVETAIKAVRKWAYVVKKIPMYDAEIIVCNNNFHGRTNTVVSFSSEEYYKKYFGPFAPGFRLVDYGDLGAIEKAMTPGTCAVLVEPIQGEAGIIVPPEGYLKGLSDLCRRKNVLLVLDEIQTGLGRTGRLFCFEHDGIRPDVLVLGKALGAGVLPISAVVADDAVLGLFTPGEHGSTFGGNPLACAVSIEALKVIVDEKLPEKADEMGAYFMDALGRIDNPMIREVRGRGLLIGLELKAEAGGARKYCEALAEQGLLCKETHEHVVRFAPPLVAAKDEIDWALERIRKVLGSRGR
jgi:ornithine--oxo-acid transaminase